MTRKALNDCLELLEARFQMTGRYWSKAVIKAYTIVLQPHSDQDALRVVRAVLSEKDDPPTDRELVQRLSGRAQRATDMDPSEFKQPERESLCEETRALIQGIGQELRQKARLPGMSTNPDEPSRAERLAESVRQLKARQAAGVPEAQVPAASSAMEQSGWNRSFEQDR